VITPLNESYQGTYTGVQVLTMGAYNATTARDPSVYANTTGNTYALQKPDLGIAQARNTSVSEASAYKGQAASFAAIISAAQAINPNF
jgi:hypothetical protein